MTGPGRDRRLEQLFGDSGRGVLATIRSDGRPQLSNVDYCYDRATRVLRVSTTEGRAKVANLKRDPRASFYVPSEGFGTYAVADGTAEISPVARALDDDTVEELVDVYRRIQGEHPDWADYRRAMVADRRLILRVRLERFYGFAP